MALIRAGELGYPTARLQALPSKAELLLRQGRLDEGQRLESALSECEKLDDPTIFGSFASALARVHLALGDLDQAIVVMDRGVAACGAIGPLVGTEPTLGYGVEVYLRAGQEQSARELLDALATIAGRAASPFSLAHLADARGLFAAHENRHDDAADHFRQAAARWQAMEAPFEEALARRRLAERLLLAGDPSARDEATREVAAARATFERLGAPRELAAADALAARHGLAPQPAKPAPRKGELTPREREVIALIAQGRSNRAIAEALIISEKTAQIHVGNILGKLGFSSRAQAAAYAVEQGLADAPKSAT